MRSVTRWLQVLLAGLALCAPLPAAKTTEPKVVVVLALVGIGGETRRKDAASVNVIAGYVKGKGWLKSEKAGPLMQKGDRMVLYTLDSPGWRVGEVELTDNGRDRSPNFLGWEFEARVTRSPGKKKWTGLDRFVPRSFGPYMETVGIWRTPGCPQPKWIAGTALRSDNSTYRSVVAKWLQSRGVPAAACKKTQVRQIIKADLNGDKRDEVLIWFNSPEACCTNNPEVPTLRYSYLIMRYLPAGGQTPRTMVLSDYWAGHYLYGLCDLDGDGWAEIISYDREQESGLDLIYHWNGKRFQAIEGCGNGV